MKTIGVAILRSSWLLLFKGFSYFLSLSLFAIHSIIDNNLDPFRNHTMWRRPDILYDHDNIWIFFFYGIKLCTFYLQLYVASFICTRTHKFIVFIINMSLSKCGSWKIHVLKCFCRIALLYIYVYKVIHLVKTLPPYQ